MTLRMATEVDLPALLALEQACFPPPLAYSPEEYRLALRHEEAVNLALDEAGALVGYVGAFVDVRQNVDEKPRPAGRGGIAIRAQRRGHVFTLNVHPSARRRGHGRRLLEACEARLRALGAARVVLEVNVGNAAAIALYEGVGYARRGRLRGYYCGYPDNDAWRYEKAL